MLLYSRYSFYVNGKAAFQYSIGDAAEIVYAWLERHRLFQYSIGDAACFSCL